MKILGIIPARYASSRFPGKPLVDIAGTSMIQRVYQQASKAKSLTEVLVATDDDRIFRHVSDFGGKVLMTSVDCSCGTVRCGEALELMNKDGKDFDVAINIQGDEPFIYPDQIDLVASCFKKPEVQIATLAIPLTSAKELSNPNRIKVVLGKDKIALYFSRQAIPFIRDRKIDEWTQAYSYYRHIGIYAYRSEVLKKIVLLEPSPLEKAESLEQLTWLFYGYSIHAEITDRESISIDVPEDLEKMKGV